MRTRQIFLLSAICLAVGITTAGLLVSREQSTPTPGASALGEHRQADPVAARHTNQTLQATAIEALPK